MRGMETCVRLKSLFQYNQCPVMSTISGNGCERLLVWVLVVAVCSAVRISPASALEGGISPSLQASMDRDNAREIEQPDGDRHLLKQRPCGEIAESEGKRRVLRLETRQQGNAPYGAPSSSETLARELEEEVNRVKQFRSAATPDVTAQPLGKSRGPGSSKLNRYWQVVESLVRYQWEDAPTQVLDRPHSAIIRFRLFRDGTAKNVVIHQTSEDSCFDNSAQRAVQQSRHFPPFPAQMTDPYQDVDMTFTRSWYVIKD